MSAKRFFFAQDDESHWYMVPEEQKTLWDEWASTDYNWQHPSCDVFEEYRTNGGIELYTFENPIEDNNGTS